MPPSRDVCRPKWKKATLDTLGILSNFSANYIRLVSNATNQPVQTVNQATLAIKQYLPKPMANSIRKLDLAYSVSRHLTTIYCDEVLSKVTGHLAAVRPAPPAALSQPTALTPLSPGNGEDYDEKHYDPKQRALIDVFGAQRLELQKRAALTAAEPLNRPAPADSPAAGAECPPKKPAKKKKPKNVPGPAAAPTSPAQSSCSLTWLIEVHAASDRLVAALSAASHAGRALPATLTEQCLDFRAQFDALFKKAKIIAAVSQARPALPSAQLDKLANEGAALKQHAYNFVECLEPCLQASCSLR